MKTITQALDDVDLLRFPIGQNAVKCLLIERKA